MATDHETTPLYRHRAVAAGYDALNALLWLPRGSDHLRRTFVATLRLQPGERVLELGCGTGLVTRHLCAAGAAVTAVDRAPAMLAAAERRAPQATFVTADVGSLTLDGQFDHVVLAFVLHELDADTRVELLRRSAGWLSTNGRVAVLEWATPAGPLRSRSWAAIVRAIEPPVAHDILGGGLGAAIAGAGLTIEADCPAAGGRARITHLTAVTGARVPCRGGRSLPPDPTELAS